MLRLMTRHFIDWDILKAEITRCAMYVYNNTEARLPNHCCCEKPIGVTYSEFVFVALVFQHSKRMRRLYCHLWAVWIVFVL